MSNIYFNHRTFPDILSDFILFSYSQNLNTKISRISHIVPGVNIDIVVEKQRISFHLEFVLIHET